MRNSNRLLFNLLIAAIVALLSLYIFQGVWLKLIMRMMSSSQSAGLPTSSTPISGLSFPTQAPAVSLNTEVKVGNLDITVTGIVSPADHVIGTANRFNVIEKDEEYLMVYIKTRCVSKSETCRLTEFDFGVESSSGRDYPAELSGSYSDSLKGLFEGGDIPPGQNLGGSLIFIIKKGERGLTLVYPRMFSFGASAKFLLGK
jgi:hypothetical protein